LISKQIKAKLYSLNPIIDGISSCIEATYSNNKLLNLKLPDSTLNAKPQFLDSIIESPRKGNQPNFETINTSLNAQINASPSIKPAKTTRITLSKMPKFHSSFSLKKSPMLATKSISSCTTVVNTNRDSPKRKNTLTTITNIDSPKRKNTNNTIATNIDSPRRKKYK